MTNGSYIYKLLQDLQGYTTTMPAPVATITWQCGIGVNHCTLVIKWYFCQWTHMFEYQYLVLCESFPDLYMIFKIYIFYYLLVSQLWLATTTQLLSEKEISKILVFPDNVSLQILKKYVLLQEEEYLGYTCYSCIKNRKITTTPSPLPWCYSF